MCLEAFTLNRDTEKYYDIWYVLFILLLVLFEGNTTLFAGHLIRVSGLSRVGYKSKGLRKREASTKASTRGTGNSSHRLLDISNKQVALGALSCRGSHRVFVHLSQTLWVLNSAHYFQQHTDTGQ